jgi:NAD(P)-dependent dehydrogenase (short-subunit alcohol dehydrogenase family)
MLSMHRQAERMTSAGGHMDLRGTNAVVTGASRGLGRAVAIELARLGVRVALVARGEGALREVAEATGGVAIPGDVGVESDVDRIVAEAQHALGTIDLLVNAASTLGPVPLPLLLDLPSEDLADALRTNVVGPFRLTRALVGPMVLRERGVVVTVSSDAAVEHYPRWGAYAAGKAAFDHLTATFAAELAGTGVRLFSFDPGEMDTRMHADAVPDADPSTLQRPEDVARRLVARIVEV